MKKSLGSFIALNRRALLMLGVVVSLAVFGIATWRTSAWTTPVGIAVGGEKASVGESGDPEWARSLEEHIKNGTFEMMSSAKQLQLQLKAGMKYEDGVLKPGIPNDVRPYAKLFDTKRLENLASSEGILAALANPLVNNPALDLTAQRTQSESTVLLIGGNNLVASYNDSGSFLGGVNSFTGYSTTTDMGATWTDRGIVPLLGQQNFGDPVLARSASTGSVFLATLSGGTNGMNIYKSTDNGVTFTTVADGAPGAVSSGTDKEWIAVDNFAGGGNGNVYHTYRDFGAAVNAVMFSRSTNDGVSFSAPILIDSGADGNVQGPFVVVGPDHTVYVFYYDSAGAPDTIKVRKSTDLGLTFAAAVVVSNLTTTGTNGSLNVPAGYRSSAFPSCAASPTNANFLACVHGDITVAGGNNSNIIYNQSTDGGATWSANLLLNSDAGTNAQTHPAMTIMPDGSALSATWQDNRDDAANRRVKRFGVIGTIVGNTVTFGPNFQVSQPDWAPIFGADPVVNTVYMGDYDTMDADNSFFYSTFTDCRGGAANGQDVRFAMIPKAGPGAIIGFRSSNVTALNPANNSCTDLFITLANNGTADAAGVTANFTTATPGVTLTQNTNVPYGAIAAGGTAVNATPIKMSVANNFACGTPIVIDVVASTGEAFSFSVNTQGLGYSITTAAGQTINGGTTRVDGVGGDDTVTSGVAIPFPFPFNGTNFNTINVSSNGNAQFTSASTAFTNVCPLPSATLNNLLAGHWDDLRTDRAGGGIFTSVTGSTPNRVFNIEWRAVTFSTPESPIVFEIRLYETGGIIEYVYSNVTGNATNTNGSSATVGVQKGTGAVPATDVSQFSCNTASLSNGFLVRFTPVSACPQGNGTCPLGASADLAITKTDGVTTVTAGQNITYTIVATNNGPSPVVGATVTDTFPAALTGVNWTCVASPGSACPAGGAGNINALVDLLNGGTATFTATATVNPAATFAFSNTATVAPPMGTTDPVPGNNSARDTDTICPPGVVPVTNEVEPNGTSGTAQVLTLNAGNNNSAIVAASIAPANDVDFFTFTAPAGSRVWVETDTGGTQNPGATSRDTVFDLLAADGTTVIENDDDDGTGNGGDGTIETGLASIIGGRTLTAGGTYFIRARAFSATGIVDPYRLFLTVTNVAATPETEANNTAATANPIVTAGSSTGLISGNIATGGDVDYFSVVANAGERVYFNADGDPGRTGTGTDLVVEFRDPADALLLTVDSSITGSAANPTAEGANFTVGPAGTYFVRVRHFSGTGVGTYHLMVTNGRTTGTCQPTAAGVTVSGRVLTPDGYGLRNASVAITDSSGMTRTARTSSFGYYTFENVEVGGTYVVSVSSKRYTFAPRTITVNDAVSDFDFTAEGPSQ